MSTETACKDVITFVLQFERNNDGKRRLIDSFPRLAQWVRQKCLGLFNKWHASCRPDHTLWLRFKVQPQQKANLLQTVQSELSQSASSMGFQVKEVREQTEGEAFGEGDTRQGYDVFSSVGGSAGMPKLWQQVQTATEWASEDLPKWKVRPLPSEWHPWACHIYYNLLGRKGP